MIPSVTPSRMNEVDEKVPEKYGVPARALMENAGRQLAELLREKFSHDDRIHVLAGPGNNGGDGLVAARFLHSWGFDVSVEEVGDGRSGLSNGPLRTAETLGLIRDGEDPDVLVDALLGYGLRGDPRPPHDSRIDEINSSDAAVVSVDVPSGLDAETGDRMDPAVDPDITVTFALPKTGMTPENSGEIWVADIGVPDEVFAEYGIDTTDLFRERSLEKIEDVT